MLVNNKWLKEIAKHRVKDDVSSEEELSVFLGIWWSRKYNLPSNHPLFLNRTMEEHLIDYHTHDLLDKPAGTHTQTIEELEQDEAWYKDKLGEEFKEDYDYLIDPDSDESFEQWMAKQNKVGETLGDSIDDEEDEEGIKSLDEIDDDFTQMDSNK